MRMIDMMGVPHVTASFVSFILSPNDASVLVYMCCVCVWGGAVHAQLGQQGGGHR